jgi:WD40 repeat protein
MSQCRASKLKQTGYGLLIILLFWGVELNAQTEPRLVLPIGHTDVINSAAFSPDGKLIVTASMDNTARIWDASSGKLLQTLTGHTRGVESATFSPDGKRIVSVSADNTARIWDASSGQLLYTLTHNSGVNSATFSPDGKTIVTASNDSAALIWDASSGELLKTLSGHADDVICAIFSPDGKSIVTGSRDYTARIWDALSGQLLHTLSVDSSWIYSAIFSSDGKRIATANGLAVCIWDVFSGQLLKTLSGYTNLVESAKFSPDGKKIVTASDDGTAQIWDVSSGHLLHMLSGHKLAVSSVTFSPDGKKIVTASLDNTTHIWDASSGKLLYKLAGNTAIFSPDGNSILTASADIAHIWDASSGLLLHSFFGHTLCLYSATFSPVGKMIVSAIKDYTASIWDVTSGQNLGKLAGHSSWVKSATFSPDGKTIVTASHDSTARIWDASKGQLLQTLSGHTNLVESATFSPDGKTIVTASHDSTARIWDALSGKLLHTLSGYSSWVFSATFSPDGETIVTACDDGTARIWDASSGKLLNSRAYDKSDFNPYSFSSDGKRVITYRILPLSFSNEPVKIWNAANGELLQTLSGDYSWIYSAIFSPDGKNIITTGGDHKTIIWDASTGKPLYTRLQLTGNDWLVYDENYRFDGTEGAINYLYFVCGLEVVELAQLKDSLWVPGLAEKIMKGEEILINDKPAPKLKNLNICEYTPFIEAPKQDGKKLRYRIVPRRGGLGNTEVIINGNPTYSYAPNQLERKTEEGKEVYYLNLNTDTLQDYLTASAGVTNPLQVKAGVKGSGIYGRGETFELFKSTGTAERPKFYGVFVGVNDYGNPQGANNANRYRDLTFAKKDAGDMANAVEACARNLFDKDSCFIYRLNGEDNMAPTKYNLQRVLGEIGKKARASDVLYIFFAGHGDLMETTDGSKQIRFLLQNAEKRNLKSGSFGTEDLTDWCHPRKIKAQKRVFVFDACHSSQFMNETYAAVQGRGGDDEGKRIRQLDKLKDQNGMMILAASAENESAYEDETLNQGVLTYHLLQAMKTQSKDTTLTVRTWFDETIDMVKDYCRQNGQQQEPRSFGDGYFYIGNVNDSVRNRIDIACPKIRIGSSKMRGINATSKAAYPGVQDKLNVAFTNGIAGRGELVYSKQTDKSYHIVGNYNLQKGKLEMDYDLYYGDEVKKANIVLKAKKYKSEDEAVQAFLQSVGNEIELLSAEWRKKNCKISR